MSYLPITIIAYILNGLSLVVDKGLVDNSIKSPFVYTFYIGILSILTLLLIPFGFSSPSLEGVIFAVLAGLTFIIGLITFFTALRTLALTIVGPIVGIVNPVFALLTGLFIINQKLSTHQLTSFTLLILGGLILTFNLWWKKHSMNKEFLIMIASGCFFGLSYVLLREAFLIDSFVNGLVFSRISMFIVASAFLLFPKTRQEIFSSKLTDNHFANKTSFLVITSQLAGGISGLMIAYAVSLANPAIVNSLYGVQYIVLLLAVLILSKYYPHYLDETLNRKVLFQKILAIVLMFAGLIYLAR